MRWRGASLELQSLPDEPVALIPAKRLDLILHAEDCMASGLKHGDSVGFDDYCPKIHVAASRCVPYIINMQLEQRPHQHLF